MEIRSEFLVLLFCCLLIASFRKIDADEVDDYLAKLNKPYVKSINSPDGDIIDCVNIYSQPAFDDPMMKNHTIQFYPSDYPEELSPKSENDSEETMPQIWHQNGRCPEDTIPVRRTTREEVLRARSMDSFARKLPHSLPRPGYSIDANTPDNHQRAYAFMTRAKFFGGKAFFSVWEPQVAANEFSSSQLWVMTDDELSGPEINIIEAGWQVYPAMYGDNRPRIFNYWTRDNYASSGCYDLKCKGFVQTSNKHALGAALDFSVYNGKQMEMGIYIFKSNDTWPTPPLSNSIQSVPDRPISNQITLVRSDKIGRYSTSWMELDNGGVGHDKFSKDWWLQIGNDRIGYWPNDLFTSLSDTAYTIQWGGEVIDTKAGGQHTTTQMGSGHFPDEGYKKAAYVRDLRVVDYTYAVTPANGLQLYSDDYKCYGLSTHVNPQYGIFLYYGGPGRNANCP